MAQTTAGRLSARFHPTLGLTLLYDGVPVLRGGLLQVFAQNPTDSFISGGARATVSEEKLPDGGKALVARHDGRRGHFECEQRIELHPDDTATISLRGRWLMREPARYMEWAAGKAWGPALAGARWRATGPDAEGVFAAVVKPGAPRRVIPFQELDIDGRPFGLRVTAGADSPDMVLFDGRADTGEWAQGDKVFWLGCLQARPDAEGRFSRTLTLQFRPGTQGPRTTDSLTIPAKVIQPDSSAISASTPLLLPKPKEARFGQGAFRLSARTRLYGNANLDGRLARAVDRLVGEWTGAARLPAGEGAWSGKGLLVAVGATAGITPPARAEGYRLVVTPRGIAVVGADAAGAFYGLQTLRQLARAEAGGVRVAACDVTDWPSLRFRGAHLFVGKDSLPFHKKLIDRILSRYKINHLVLECEYTRWDSHPEIAVPYAMSKKDLAEDIAYARERFMDVTPLINTLGHCRWIFENGQHKDLAEDPNSLQEYCPNNEGSYKLVFDVYSEALALFKPKMFHIGHDEVTLFGRFPNHPQCLAAGATKEEAVTNLFLKDVQRLHDWLAERGVKTTLWSDMLLHASESSDGAANAQSPETALDRRKRLPSNAIICDWHYQPAPEEKFFSVSLFQKQGFPAIATTWYQPENIARFARAAIRQNALGLLQSTWAGFDSNEGVLRQEFRQFTAFVLAAEYAWSGNPLPPDQLPYRPDTVFLREWRRDDAAARRSPAWSLDLSAATNAALPALANLPATLEADGAPIHVQPGRAILLAGKLNPESTSAYPKSVNLPVGRKASSLVLVHGTLLAAASPTVGRYVVTYEDGSTQEIPLTYAENILAFDDQSLAWQAEAVWSGADGNGQGTTVRSLHWANPHPEKTIRSLTLRAEDSVAAPALIGVAGMR